MPTKIPVSNTAHCIFFHLKDDTSTSTILSATPLSSTILPSIAPNDNTIINPPKVLPMPVFIDDITFNAGIPNNKPVTIDEISNPSTGFILKTIKMISKIIPASAIKKCIVKN